MFDPGERTACGLSLADLRELMARRVTVWADRRHAQRVERDRRHAAIVAKRLAQWSARQHRQEAARRRWAREATA